MKLASRRKIDAKLITGLELLQKKVWGQLNQVSWPYPMVSSSPWDEEYPSGLEKQLQSWLVGHKWEVLLDEVGFLPQEKRAGIIHNEQKIYFSKKLNQGETYKSLVHEICHVIDNKFYKNDHERRRTEVAIEAATFVVCYQMGWDTSPYSVPYLLGYGDKFTMAILKKERRRILTIAQKLTRELNMERRLLSGVSAIS